MKKNLRKLTLNRDTVRNLSAPTLQDAVGGMVLQGSVPRCSGACTPVSCHGSCNAACTLGSCNPTCTCPSFCPCP